MGGRGAANPSLPAPAGHGVETSLTAFANHHLTCPHWCTVRPITQIVIAELTEWTDHILVLRPYIRESPIGAGRA